MPRYEDDCVDGKTIHGGYGPRLFAWNRNGTVVHQINNVLALLKRKPSSRRAVIQFFDAADIAKDHIEIPCTCTLQFLIRNRRLHLFASMRSNDAFLGFYRRRRPSLQDEVLKRQSIYGDTGPMKIVRGYRGHAGQ